MYVCPIVWLCLRETKWHFYGSVSVYVCMYVCPIVLALPSGHLQVSAVPLHGTETQLRTFDDVTRLKITFLPCLRHKIQARESLVTGHCLWLGDVSEVRYGSVRGGWGKRARAQTHTHTQARTHARTHSLTHAHTHTHTCTRSHARTRSCARTHARTQTRTHTHTHTHTHLSLIHI